MQRPSACHTREYQSFRLLAPLGLASTQRFQLLAPWGLARTQPFQLLLSLGFAFGSALARTQPFHLQWSSEYRTTAPLRTSHFSPSGIPGTPEYTVLPAPCALGTCEDSVISCSGNSMVPWGRAGTLTVISAPCTLGTREDSHI